jgi:hypothetical protein
MSLFSEFATERNATMSKLVLRHWLGLYIFYACTIIAVGDPLRALAQNDKDCIGNSPGCINTPYCNSPSKTKPGYSCEEGFSIPNKYCDTSYGKDCETVQVNCGRINYWTGGPCSGNRCDAVIFNFADYLQTAGCIPPLGVGVGGQ